MISLEKREKKKLEPNVKETNRPDKVYLDIIKEEVITVVVLVEKKKLFLVVGNLVLYSPT
jgi:hypothetical protein